jgi:hypothetical protein
MPNCPCALCMHDSTLTIIYHSQPMLPKIHVYANHFYVIPSSDACFRVAAQLSVGLEVGQLACVKCGFQCKQSLPRRSRNFNGICINITHESIVILRPMRESTHVRAWIIAALRRIAHI